MNLTDGNSLCAWTKQPKAEHEIAFNSAWTQFRLISLYSNT